MRSNHQVIIIPVYQVVYNPCTTSTKGMPKAHSTTMNINPEWTLDVHWTCGFKKCIF